MKSIVFIQNGAADEAVKELAGRTPLELIRAEMTNRIAASGQAGTLDIDDLPAASGHRLLAELLGMPAAVADSLQRGPLWAASLNEDIEGYDYAFCANFVTIDSDDILIGSRVAGLSFEETKLLAETIQTQLPQGLLIRAVGAAQAVLLCQAKDVDANVGEAPAFKMGTRLSKYLSGFKKKSKAVADWMKLASTALIEHPVNEVRLDLAENPANFMWLWEGGPLLASKVTNRSAAMLTNSSMAEGLARMLHMPVLPLTNPWNMDAKSPAFSMPDAVKMLRDKDQLFVFVESPGCLGQFGTLAEKLRMLEAADHRLHRLFEPILEANRPYRVTVLSDSIVSTDAGVPVKGCVPFIISGEGISCDQVGRWSEKDCAEGSLARVSRATLCHMVGS